MSTAGFESNLRALADLLPEHEGLLPKWLLFISLVSVLNSFQAYISLGPTQKVYCGPDPSKAATPTGAGSPVTPLSARTFGTWTLLSSVVRLYAAYHITNPQVYELALWSYAIADAHFLSEWLLFGSTRLGPGLAGPIVVANTSLFWMWSQWGYYVK